MNWIDAGAVAYIGLGLGETSAGCLDGGRSALVEELGDEQP